MIEPSQPAPRRRARLSRRALIGTGGVAALAVLGGAAGAALGRRAPAPQPVSGGTPAPSTVSSSAPAPQTVSGSVPAPQPISGSPAATPIAAALTPQQRIGQLFMVGLPSGAGGAALAAINDAISSAHAGSLVLYGTGWSSAASVAAAVQPLKTLAAGANGGVGLFVSGNQEGGDQGTFQAFYGPGFSVIPSALAQAQGDPSALQQQTQGWGQELRQAGVNLNLAPVLDTVPPSMVVSNDPIGHWQREYGTDPQTVTEYGVAFAKGMRAGGVAACAKHFPGLGRVTGNTDFTAEGIVDSQFSGANDPFLQPYKAAIDAGVDFVMVSLAVYPQVDSSEPAVFSAPMITGILRNALGFQNVVITDDVGAAAAVADRTPGDRALGFLRAGGDMVLTVDATIVAPMAAAVAQAMAGDATFAAAVNASVDRILRLKATYGLAPGANGT